MLIELIKEHHQLIGWLGLLSVLTFFGSLLIIPWIIARIPVDYFQYEKRNPIHTQSPRPLLSKSLNILKNILGWLFILAGLGMLFLPGQGMLTVLIGMMMINFPGKYRLEKKILCRPSVLRAINWIRTRSKRPPLTVSRNGGLCESKIPDQEAL
ncbi:MAG: PGPGW domain-containing protein [Desulfohalobiaceae bacterium]|nr:PGPGW domain-containing protein [Desulfohalobiaceae bacterium]